MQALRPSSPELTAGPFGGVGSIPAVVEVSPFFAMIWVGLYIRESDKRRRSPTATATVRIAYHGTA